MVHDNTIKYNTPAPHWTECSDVWLIPCLIGLMDFLVIIKNMTRATKRSNWGAGKKKKVCSDMFSFLFRKKDKNNKPFLNTTCPDPFKCHSQVGICWQIFHIFLKSRRNICSFAASSALNLSMCNFLWFCFVTCAGCRGREGAFASAGSGRGSRGGVVAPSIVGTTCVLSLENQSACDYQHLFVKMREETIKKNVP